MVSLVTQSASTIVQLHVRSVFSVSAHCVVALVRSALTRLRHKMPCVVGVGCAAAACISTKTPTPLVSKALGAGAVKKLFVEFSKPTAGSESFKTRPGAPSKGNE